MLKEVPPLKSTSGRRPRTRGGIWILQISMATGLDPGLVATSTPENELSLENQAGMMISLALKLALFNMESSKERDLKQEELIHSIQSIRFLGILRQKWIWWTTPMAWWGVQCWISDKPRTKQGLKLLCLQSLHQQPQPRRKSHLKDLKQQL